ncbi:MAG TPA: glycosyltransferase family 2 protein [Patescibacteria group bacterium]
MVNNLTVSVVIPCYNEAPRILNVVTVVSGSTFIDEAFVVNDGSSDGTDAVLNQIKSDKISVLAHPKNLGKSASLKTGLLASSGDLIMFIDSDLKNLKPHHLLKMLEPLAYGNYDVALGDREFEAFYNKMIGYSIAFSGERVFHRLDLLKHLNLFKVKGYNIEASLNHYYFSKSRVVKVKLEGVGQTPKDEKYGVKGVFDDNKMIQQQIKFLGLDEFLNQIMAALNLPVYP